MSKGRRQLGRTKAPKKRRALPGPPSHYIGAPPKMKPLTSAIKLMIHIENVRGGQDGTKRETS